jgi:putative transcriptional regulator
VSSKSKPHTKSELAAHEAKRDLAADLLQSVREMKAGQVNVVTSPVIDAPLAGNANSGIR